jgi:hypothetical protein
MVIRRHKILLDAARRVIATTRGILGNDAKHARIVLVGGLAVMRWTGEYRSTEVS